MISLTGAGVREAAPVQVKEVETTRDAVSSVLGKVIFTCLLTLMAFSAIPYGTAQPWWKGFFICGIAAISIAWIVDAARHGLYRTGSGMVLLPLIALAVLAFLQSISLGQAAPSGTGIATPTWNAISADPLGTRFFALQLLSLIGAGAMLYRYVDSRERLRTLTHVVIGVAVASALFAILRQTTQHSPGFGLPFIKPDQGFGQFINRNHFAFLMEMGFGLTLGIIIGGGVKRERVLIYVGALLPIWTALVLSNSRGGLLAMLAQIVTAVLLFTLLPFSKNESTAPPRRRLVTSWLARVALMSVLILGVAIGTIWVGGDRLITRIEQGQEFAAVEAEIRQNARRNQIWRATWRMFSASPITGVGLGGYWTAIPTFHDASGLFTPQEAHNDYLELLASGGLVGFALGAWFLIVVFRKTRANLSSGAGFQRAACFGASLALVGVAVHSLVDFGLHMIANAAMFTALIVIATLPPLRKRGRDERT